jgi:Ca2+-binding RTX toxin-like protein
MLAGGNNDVMYGNNGNDSLAGDDGNDVIYGGQANDLIILTDRIFCYIACKLY